MNKHDFTCKIWATEVSPQGIYHRCHAESTGLAGHSYPQKEIQLVLETKPTWGGTWKMIACEPNHDSFVCNDCQYRFSKGLSCYYDLKQQREALVETKRRGADIRVIG